MKRNRKGFSLVELIVVLVIMAIIAALCAPNISAYVQAAKVQNYQTVANNLADELQTHTFRNRHFSRTSCTVDQDSIYDHKRVILLFVC